RAADLAAEKNITILIEPLNPRDRPDYFLGRVEQAAHLIDKIGRPNVRIQFDFYHVQIICGDLLTRLEKFMPYVGHVQIAAVPSRGEPDEGEINFPAVFDALDRLGYAGWGGCACKPRGRTEDGLGWGRRWGLGGEWRPGQLLRVGAGAPPSVKRCRVFVPRSASHRGSAAPRGPRHLR